MGKMKALDYVLIVLIMVGALNWGLVGVFGWNLVEKLFGTTIIVTIIYVLIDLAALIWIYRLWRN